MPIFIVLAKYTTKGVQEIKDAPERYEAAQKIAKSVGAEIKSVYYTMGRYDFVSIIEAPSIEAAMKGLFMLGAGGIQSTETLVALSQDDAYRIISEIS
ncbi:MAG: GYD domain-containing protein [Candidatus Thorarchaeota archaeon]